MTDCGVLTLFVEFVKPLGDILSPWVGIFAAPSPSLSLQGRGIDLPPSPGGRELEGGGYSVRNHGGSIAREKGLASLTVPRNMLQSLVIYGKISK